MSIGSGTGTPVTATSTRYAMVAELKSWLGIGDAVDDAVLGSCLDEASRDIEGDTHRVFYPSAAGTVRYFTAVRSGLVLIDDVVTVTAVATDGDGDRVYESAWAATDYDLLPLNAAADGLPYDQVAVAPQGGYAFPAGLRAGVKITGTWGWPSVPDGIHRACILRAAWLFKRSGSPLGTTGTAELGIQRVGRFDPDYDRLVQKFARMTVG